MAGQEGREVRFTPTCWRLIASGTLLAACPLLVLLFGRFGKALMGGYRPLSKGLVSLQATIASIAPFALWDFLVVGLALAALYTFVRRVIRRRPLLPWLSVVLLVISATLFLFVSGWALNHYAPSLASEIGLEVGAYTDDELVAATRHYLDRAAELAPLVPRDEGGELLRQDFYELAHIAGGSYRELSGSYGIFEGSQAPVKSLLLLGEPLLFSGHVGIFFPPTGESSVPLNCAVAELPFTMCHEAAHRLAIAREQEANFAAFLACTTSNDVRFSYSGYYNAFSYCYGALRRSDPDRAARLLDEVRASDPDAGASLVLADRVATGRHYYGLVLADRVATGRHYDAYEGWFGRVGSAVNDGYLRSFGEGEGVKSYGLVVDYLIAWDRR